MQCFYGMFALAVWDTRRASLFLARDRFGIKPLYLTQDGGRLRFASSLPALHAGGGVDTRIDPIALHQKVYWTLDATRPAQARSEAEWLDANRQVLVRALERHRLAADVPVGVLVSGGLDSSLLVGLLPDHVDDLLTFSIGFEGVGAGTEKADEFEYSDLIAEHFKTNHHKHLIPNSEVLTRPSTSR